MDPDFALPAVDPCQVRVRVWMAGPFVLFPLAERSIPSAPVQPVSLAGIALVLAGAYLTSHHPRPEGSRPPARRPQRLTRPGDRLRDPKTRHPSDAGAVRLRRGDGGTSQGRMSAPGRGGDRLVNRYGCTR